MKKSEFSIIIPIKNRTKIQVNYEPPGFSIFNNHEIELSNLKKNEVIKNGPNITLPLLLNNLISLDKLRYNFEVIIVDFDSTDYNLKKLITTFPRLKIKIISETSFFSRGKGLNIGINYATKENIMFCDADMMFKSKEIFKNAEFELNENKVFFPICFDLIEPSHQVGYWRETGYGIMFSTKRTLEKYNFKWSEYDKLGKEDEDAYNFFKEKGIDVRYRVPGYFHQWHPSSKFFKNMNYETGNITKILLNFDEKLISNQISKLYIENLKNDKKYQLTYTLDSDIFYILGSKLYQQVIKKEQIKEYEKKYIRKIKRYYLEDYELKVNNFKEIQILPLWLKKLIDWMKKIEKTNYNWTLKGPDILKLSSVSLFSKLATMLDNYQIFNKEKMREIIIKYLDNNDFMFKQDRNNENIISESRQAYSALLNLGYENNFDVKLDNYFIKPLYFMEEKYWENPWKAGAHFSHYVFFCNLTKNNEEIENIFNELQKYSRKDGWFSGNPSEEKIINGIMKIMTAYDIINKEIDKDILIGITDRLLNYKNYKGGCGIYDYVYILVKCYEIGYKTDEIKKILYQIYDEILEHQMDDGGFKYSLNKKSKDKYCGKEVGNENMGCIHGSVLFGMSLMMMNKILEMGINFNWVLT